MKRQAEQPKCRAGFKHDWFVLDKEDNGEEVSRCGTCKALRYRAPDSKVRHEVPEPRALA